MSRHQEAGSLSASGASRSAFLLRRCLKEGQLQVARFELPSLKLLGQPVIKLCAAFPVSISRSSGRHVKPACLFPNFYLGGCGHLLSLIRSVINAPLQLGERRQPFLAGRTGLRRAQLNSLSPTSRLPWVVIIPARRGYSLLTSCAGRPNRSSVH